MPVHENHEDHLMMPAMPAQAVAAILVSQSTRGATI
jgi:hypothetical protein